MDITTRICQKYYIKIQHFISGANVQILPVDIAENKSLLELLAWILFISLFAFTKKKRKRKYVQHTNSMLLTSQLGNIFTTTIQPAHELTLAQSVPKMGICTIQRIYKMSVR